MLVCIHADICICWRKYVLRVFVLVRGGIHVDVNTYLRKYMLVLAIVHACLYTCWCWYVYMLVLVSCYYVYITVLACINAGVYAVWCVIYNGVCKCLRVYKLAYICWC